ncbi:MAG: hypothetical protein IPM29_00705 [Planctomycetes bacterium]|nr:hypothetical protein [Planctomycetota bacterium]
MVCSPDATPRRTARRLAAATLALASLAVAAFTTGMGRGGDRPARADGCVACHVGIEEIHPGFPLSCVDCHGGDGTATAREAAHVAPALALPGDERVLPQNRDLAWQRFRNPSNLRVAREVCGDCHREAVDNMLKSLHATTAGHLGDGFYEHGIVADKRPRFSIFPVRDDDGVVPDGALTATTQVPPFRRSGPRADIATHYTDLPRKACMHCHLYSEGRAVDGRLGMDGDYRGEGCAACHVTYADDGRSRSADRAADRLEPGHPMQHRFTSAIPTATCTRCHYGDASIGLHYRGMAQLVPGMPAGPDVDGTTDRLLNGTFYIQDRDLTPPDVHHQRGMHCIDCHTLTDVMGDGNIWPQMDHAVEIECTSCHGTFDRPSELMTSQGRRVRNLTREGNAFWLTSKVTGARHRVKQVVDVLDPKHPDYDARAAAAMTGDHARLECYTCHNGWNVSFFGFHFDRNEQFTQLDLLSGERTPGRVTTQEKVFATFNQLRLGINHEGMIAPYLVGFSTIGSARDADGELILHQATPQTAAGLSGVTLVPHQMHTTRPEARTCAECHRAPVVYGFGSVNFRLTREFGFAITRRSLHAIAVDTRTPARTQAIASVELEQELRALALRVDPVLARASVAYVADAAGGLTVVDVSTPSHPRAVRRLPDALVDPYRMVCQGDYLAVADGVGGVALFDVESPARPKPLGVVATTDARDIAWAWPWLFVADGAGGLTTIDARDPSAPRALASVDLNGGDAGQNEAVDVDLLFQLSRTFALDADGRRIGRTPARHLAFVATGLDGVRVVDVTDPRQPIVLFGPTARNAFSFERGDVRGVAVNTVFDLGSEGGGIRSRERDYLYVFVEEGADANRQQRVRVFDVTDPMSPRAVRDAAPRVYGGTGELLPFRAYNEPFLQHFVVAAGSGGLGTLVDVGRAATQGAAVAATWDDLAELRDLEFEELAFDRLQDERQHPIKDISHDGCRYLDRDELLRVFDAAVPPPVRYRTDPYGVAIEALAPDQDPDRRERTR